jgi:hypothetical protein
MLYERIAKDKKHKKIKNQKIGKITATSKQQLGDVDQSIQSFN